jgi:hypothetical protein
MAIGVEMAGLGLNGPSLFVIPGLAAGFVIDVIRLPTSLRTYSLCALLPLFGCFLTAPAG